MLPLSLIRVLNKDGLILLISALSTLIMNAAIYFYLSHLYHTLETSPTCSWILPRIYLVSLNLFPILASLVTIFIVSRIIVLMFTQPNHNCANIAWHYARCYLLCLCAFVSIGLLIPIVLLLTLNWVFCYTNFQQLLLFFTPSQHPIPPLNI
ncbi:hypothetical protein NEHOM01_0312 [Nematocida homosporus]|uniref:uncharacterized protein n=1 Tax=Nematocida homosporus TaxID=1912981 RepID=UPI002220460C|nr:uncharacterized protein NEHOM01_0312 [Nematocida homosporus]KAI5184637.1 hypothetical protein NEHOM01_0312 [Nematocida homosporus]